MKKTTILLADDHVVVRQGLRALLSADPGLDVIGEANNGREAVALVGQLQPDVVVMDIAMPLLNGFEATRQILRSAPQTRVLVLSSYSDDDCVVRILQAGASGYVVKQTAAGELLKAIAEVQKGRTFLSHPLSKRLAQISREVPGKGAMMHEPYQPTSREAEVLQLIAEGFSNKQIAAELGISIKTVEKHRQQVMNRLNIHDIAGLTRYAIAKGIVERKPEV